MACPIQDTRPAVKKLYPMRKPREPVKFYSLPFSDAPDCRITNPPLQVARYSQPPACKTQRSLRQRLRDLRLFVTDLKYAEGLYISPDGGIPVHWKHISGNGHQSLARELQIPQGRKVPLEDLPGLEALYQQDIGKAVEKRLFSLTKSIERLATRSKGNSKLVSADAY